MRYWLFVVFAVLLHAVGFAGDRLRTGAERMELYLPLLEGRNIALVANHSSLVCGTHLLDTLLSSGVVPGQIVRIFSPEHGFRGDQDAGAEVVDGRDPLSGIAVSSLYGSKYKPTAEQLEGVDLLLFDLQDVGVRFYTYISTLHYVMEACAEANIPVLVLDRPNPNGNYVDGPVREPGFQSFVGMHPIPVVHGLTMGELARMIDGEAWLDGAVDCELKMIPCLGYTHSTDYEPPVKPSPNLPDAGSIRLYPSTCFFEGTVISEGRGTRMPFSVYGHPELKGDFSFTPESIPGMSMNPRFKGIICHGRDLRTFSPHEGWKRIHLEFLLEAYKDFPRKDEFFIDYFDKLAGTSLLREQISNGWSEAAIRESWQEGLSGYKEMRRKYLIYDED